MPVIESIIFDCVKKIVINAISKRVNYETEKFFVKFKIESKVQESIAKVVERLIPFFQGERISETQQIIIMETIDQEISIVLAEPSEIFASSLDGQKIYDRIYANGILPQAIRDENVEDLYAKIFPHIANLVCAYPPIVEQWKIEGYKDGFRRLDEIAITLGDVVDKIDSIISKEMNTSDVLLLRIRQTLLQRVQFQLELSGLRGDRPDAVPLEKCFIIPEFCKLPYNENSNKNLKVGNEKEIFTSFVGNGARKLILGSPGSGKSTWSRWFQKIILAQKDPKLAVLVRLRDLIKNKELPSHTELVREVAGTHFRDEVNSAIVRYWCDMGAICFILDGFDEIPPNKRETIVDWIKELEVAINKAGLILTSRPLTTSHLDKLSEKWQSWELTPFDETRITEYIKCWYSYAPVLNEKTREVDAVSLAKTWMEDETIRLFVGTPLMLATILMVHHMDGELPRGRAKLYQRYIEGMLGLWDSRWGVVSEIDLPPEIKKQILTCLALYFFANEIEQLGDSDIEHVLSKLLPELNLGCTCSVPIVLNYLRERTGLLIGPGTWSFIHKNVCEFLVASTICDGDQSINGQKLDRLHLFKERHNDRWNAVLFFWAGLSGLGDLKFFIEQVEKEQTNNDWVLALSLIYDQFQPHRLYGQWVCDIIHRFLKVGLKLSEDETFLAPISCPKIFKIELTRIPSLTMRGFEQTVIFTVISELLKTCKIDWNQVSNSDESILFAPWYYFAVVSEKKEDINSAFDKKNWKKPIPIDWVLFAFRCRVISIPDIEEFLEMFCCNFPEHAGKAIFILMSSLLESKEYYGIKVEIQTRLNGIVFLKKYEVDQLWLIGSTTYSTRFLKKYKDLLKSFLKELDYYIKDKVVNDATTISEVKTYLMELQKKRIKLLRASKLKTNQIAATLEK